ncbi:ARL4C protein, partial [Polyodon spathula]|nr:ARL4C protein [Polyodon spathula]
MLGLDSAGKTTVLYRLKFNEFVNTVPTIGFNTEKIKLSNGTAKGISCHFWDVGGQEKLRPLWKSYSRCTDGIIYVVDSVDVDRLEEAKTELHKVTKFAENQGTPLLVIANKQDLPKSLPVADIEKQLALHELCPSTAYHVQPACAIIGEGLPEGMDKLYEMILKRRKSLKQKKKRLDAILGRRPIFTREGIINSADVDVAAMVYGSSENLNARVPKKRKRQELSWAPLKASWASLQIIGSLKGQEEHSIPFQQGRSELSVNAMGQSLWGL